MGQYNNKQLEAISSKKNVTVVIAGAGSGKTTVLVQRINKIMENGVLPQNILAITFTNKAANEMKERLIKKVGPHAFGICIMTFHALAIKIIKENISYLEHHNRNFIIVDDEDKKKIIKNILKEKELTDTFKVPEVMYAIGNAKSKSLTYKNVVAYMDVDKKEIYQEYQNYCQKNNAMDFDDLLITCYELLKISEIKKKYNDLFKFIHVDEFQDTSLIQNEILRKIKGAKNNLFIVGDIDQSIYTWRGATIDNLLKIHEDYEDVKIVKLEQNYRSTKEILQKANKLIEKNNKRIEKTLWTDNEQGEDINYVQVNTNIDEANHVIREISFLVDHNKSTFNDFAILYRYNYQSRKIEEKLIKNKIPYRIFGGIKFYERMEIKDILAYLRVFINNNDNISLSRIINVPKRKAGEKTVEKLVNYAKENNLSLFNAIEDIGTGGLKDLEKLIKKYSHLIDIKDNADFEKTFNEFLQGLKYKDYLLTIDEESKVEERIRNIKELQEGIIQEIELDNNIVDYINEMSLFNDVVEDEKEEVTLSTIHGVKGLEFENVFLISLVEGRFPKEKAFFDDDEMEEERRLAYVAATRAKKRLWLSSYLYDFKYTEQDESRFIKEMGIQVKDKSLEDFIF